MSETKTIYGLRKARIGFTDMFNAARDGKSVTIVEIGLDRKTHGAYELRKLSESEVKKIQPWVAPKDRLLPLPE